MISKLFRKVYLVMFNAALALFMTLFDIHRRILTLLSFDAVMSLFDTNLNKSECCNSEFPQHLQDSQLHRVGEQGLYKF